MADRRLLLRAWLHAMGVLEVRLRADQGRARNAMIRTAATEYTKHGHPPAHVFAAHRARVKGVIEDHYRRTIPVFGKMALAQIRSRRVEGKAAQTLHEWLTARWIEREALRKANMIADTDRDDVLAAIQEGLNEGLGVEEIARNIRKVSRLTAYRAAVVARTETHAAATYGSIESVRQAEQDLGVVMVKEWLPAGDKRTRDSHLDMANHPAVALDEKFAVRKKGGGVDHMDRPGDTSGSPENTINCLHPSSVIQSGKIKAMTRHWYEGQLVTIKTHGGNELTVTPNHPVLTRGGWVAAGALKKGHGVISSAFINGVPLGSFDIKHIEPTAKQIFDALSEVRMVVRVDRVNVDFHGEKPDGDVDVVHATRQLRNSFVSAFSQPLEHLRLASTDFAQGRLLAYRLLYGNGVVVLGRLIANGFVSLFRQARTFLRRGVCHPLEHALAAVAWGYAVVGETGGNVLPISAICQRKLFDRFAGKKTVGHLGGIKGSFSPLGGRSSFADLPHVYASTVQAEIDRGGRDAVLLGKLRDTKPGKVLVDEVASIGHRQYSGFVYNLETYNGYYVCNGIVQHNCRCAIIYQEKDE